MHSSSRSCDNKGAIKGQYHRGVIGLPSMTEPIIMGLKVEPRITYPSQSNRGTQGHHNPYPMIRPPGARDQLESESEIEKKLIEQAIKSGEAVTKPLKNWWED